MRYIPTPDLWNHHTAYMVRTGQLKLQPGQYVKCGQEKPSRFVAMTEGKVIVAAHPQDQGKAGERFKPLCNIYLDK